MKNGFPLKSKYFEIFKDPNQQINRSTNSIHPTHFEFKGPNNEEFNGQHCNGLNPHDPEPNQTKLNQEQVHNKHPSLVHKNSYAAGFPQVRLVGPQPPLKGAPYIAWRGSNFHYLVSFQIWRLNKNGMEIFLSGSWIQREVQVARHKAAT